MGLSPLTLIVEFEIRSESVDRDGWLEVWAQRAKDAWDHEPYTPAYGAAVSPDHNDRVLIFERYQRGEESLASHMNRSAHTALMDEMTARNMTRRRLSLVWLDETPDWGRWTPTRNDQAVADLTLDVTGLRFNNEATKADFIERTLPVAATLAAQHDAIKIFGLGEQHRQDDRNPELAEGDLVLVSVTGAPDPLAVRAITDHADTGAITFARTYQTVDAGYLWR